MPSKSESQRRLFAAAAHGATFAKAKQLRQSLTHEQLHDFAVKVKRAPAPKTPVAVKAPPHPTSYAARAKARG